MSGVDHRGGATAPLAPGLPGGTGAPRSLVELLRRRAGAGDGRGYTFLDDSGAELDALTFTELDLRARAIAVALAEGGARPGERALLLFPPGLDFVAAFFGCLYAGIAAVPGYPPRSRRGLPRVAAVARDSGARLALTAAADRPRFEALASAAGFDGLAWVATDRLDPVWAGSWRDPGAGLETIAFLQYTSGSTGDPKGVMVSHGNLLHNEEAIRRAFGQSAESVIVGWLPLYHDMGLIGNVLQPLWCNAARCVLMSPLAFLQRPRLWLEAITRYRATTSGGPDFAYRLCVRKVPPPERDGLDLSSWAVAFDGAEPVRADTLDLFAEAFAPHGFDRRAFLPCYGLAEATLLVSGEPPAEPPRIAGFDSSALERGRAEPAAGGRRLVACGEAAGGQRIEIVDPDSRRPLPAGTVGEIWVAGPSVAGGYWRRPEASAETFGARLADGAGPFLRTGDLGFVDGGRLFVAGRLKDLIIVRGRNHHPHDLERTAEASHPALRPGCGAAFAIEAEGEERLVIAQEVERSALREVDPVELAEAIRAAIAEHHDLQVEAVALLLPGGVPKTSSGKVQRRECRKRFLGDRLKLHHLSRRGAGAGAGAVRAESGGTAPEPEPEAAASAGDPPVAPAPDPAEIDRLAALVRRKAAPVLRVPEASLADGRSLALDSLAAIELKVRLEASLGASLPLDAFFDGPTPRSLAEVAWAALEAAGGPAANTCSGPAPSSSAPRPAGGPAPAEWPLTAGQRALWFVDRLARAAGDQAASSAYHVAAAVRAPFGIDTAALGQALEWIAARHPALAGTFHESDRGPVLRAGVAADPVEVVAAADLDPAGLERRLAEEAARPFDLESGPPFRAVVFRLPAASGGDRLLLVFHHLAVDLWSLGVVAGELGAFYPAAVNGEEPPALPASALRLSDLARWQDELLSGPEGARQGAFWRRELAGVSAALDLPTDRPRPPVQSFRAGSVALRLPAAETAALRRLADSSGSTLFAVLLAGWQATLARWSNQDDLVVGTPAAGRGRAGLERLVGYLVNPLPLRARLGGDPEFGELVARTGRAVVAALDHADYPFPRLVEELAPRRDPARPPLVQALLALERPHRPAGGRIDAEPLAALALGRAGTSFELGGLGLETVALPRTGVQFDLELVAAELGGALEMTLHYAADLLDESTAARLGAACLRLLAAGAERPETRVSRLPLLPEPERRQVLVEWSGAAGTSLEAAGEISLDQMLARWAGSEPSAPAIAVLDSGEVESLTYRELDLAAGALAVRLRSLGAGPETLVAVAMPRSPALVAAFLGVLRAGACYLPLDPAYPVERLSLMLADSAAPIVVAADGVAERLDLESSAEGASARRVLRLAGTGAAEVRELAAAGETPRDRAPAARDSAAYAIYTSGSTGRPKGVVLTRRGLVNLARAQARGFGVGPDDRVLLFAAVSFDASVSEIGMALAAGAAVCVAPPGELLPGPPLAAALERLAVTHVTLPPSALAALPEPGPAALTTVISAGEALPAALAARWARDRRLIDAYGPTEVTVCASLGEVDAESAGAGVAPGIGRPLDGARCLVLDRRAEPAPPGVPGELWVGGAGLARGYLGRAGLTADRFRPDPWAGAPGGPPAGARLYRTGDRARWRLGGPRAGSGAELEYLGRLDDQVKVRGFRVEPAEVEAALAALPGVREAAVAVRGEGAAARLIAWVVPATGAMAETATAEAIRSALAERLPDHLVPGQVVTVEDLARSPAGKVDRRALPVPAAASAAGAAPTGELERTIAAVWSTALGVEAVPADRSFFDLGGHSLLLAQVHRRLAGVLPREVSMVDLYRYPTVRSLARFAARDTSGEVGAADTGRRRALHRLRAGSSGERERTAVAVVGLACRFPGAAGPDQLWRRLIAGDDLVRDLTDEELDAAGVPAESRADPAYVKAALVLEGIDLFDAEAFGYNPAEAESLDPQQRLFLECALEALEDAGCDPERFVGDIGVFAGAGIESYLLRLLGASAGAGLDPAAAYQLTVGNLRDFLATRVSYKLGLTGPSVSVQTACSTSLVAVHLACRSLLAGECDAALAGGVSLEIPPGRGYRYQPGMILSPDGRCRPFSAGAAGTVRGSGAGVVALRRLDDALAAGDRIRAVILGTAINNDGALKAGFTAPSVERQAAVIAEAQAFAGVEPASVGYVEAHGTGTEVGDPIEVTALAEAFGRGRGAPAAAAGPSLIGSIKSNLGHCDAAAGVAGLIKAVLALEAGRVPPSLHCQRPHPGIDFAAAGFRVATEPSGWPERRGDGGEPLPRRCGVSSFGIGGTNAHAVLEQAPAPVVPEAAEEAPGPDRRWRLLTLSAASEPALAAAAEALAARLDEPDAPPLADAELTLHTGRRALEHRRVVLCRDAAEAGEALRSSDPQRVFAGRRPAAGRDVAFLFPGQGAQHPGMAEELARREPVFRDWLDRACARLEPLLGLDLRRVLFPAAGDQDAAAKALAETRLTQPALFAVEHALARLWRSWGVEPAAMLGHSIGELVAAVVAGVLRFEDGLALVAARGRLMQEMPPGSMLALPLSETEAEELLAELGDDRLALAAINAAQAVVVGGPDDALTALAARLGERGVEGRRLRTSHAFHSPAMAPAAARLAAEVATLELAAPRRPYLSNVTGDWIAAEQATDPGYWGEQLRRPVRFADGLGRLLAEPGRALLEVGPGHALVTLARRHPAAAPDLLALPSLPHPRDPRAADAAVLTALGRLWAGGVAVDWDGFHAGERRRKVALPTYRFQRRRYWLDPPAAEERAAGVGAGEPAADGVAGWFYLPGWRPSAVPVGAPPAAESWLVLAPAGTGEPDGEPEAGAARPVRLARALIARLRTAGCAVATAEPGVAFGHTGGWRWIVRPGEREDFAAVLSELAAADRPPRRILHLWTTGGGGPATALDLGIHSLFALAQALGERPAETSLAVVSTGARAVGAESPVPEIAAVLGPCRVLPQEAPGLSCRHLDVEAVASTAAAERLAGDLVADLAGGDPATPPVAYRGGVRWLEEHRPVPLPAVPAEPAGGAVLITGGFGGLGAALARRLARLAGTRLALTGRTRLPRRAAWDAVPPDHPAAPRIALVRELEALGAEVLPLAADAADPAAAAAAVAAARQRFGALDAVVHAAGVAGGGVIQRRRREEIEAVLAPKLAGARALEAALGDEPPPRVVLFSSLASAVGGFGQADYAAANCALDALAEGWRARHPGSWCCAVGWGGWADVGMGSRGTPAAAGVAIPGAGIRPEQGLEALDRLLAHRPAPRVLITPDPPAEVAAFHARLAADPEAAVGLASGAEAARGVHPRPDLQTPYVEPRGELEERVATLWRRLLALERVGAHDSFFELGGTSLLGVQMVTELERATGVVIPAVSLYEGSSVRALSAVVARLRRDDGGDAGADEGEALEEPRRSASNAEPRRPAAAQPPSADERAAEERGARRRARLARLRAAMSDGEVDSEAPAGVPAEARVER